MTNTARMVIRDCKIALEMLEEEQDKSRWMVLWAGGVALLRSVGHVLDKIDARSSNGKPNELYPLSQAAFRMWRSGEGSNRIFTEFIDEERNNILKEYQSAVYPNENIQLVSTDSHGNLELFEIESDLYRPILNGFGAGEDARDIFLQAIEWWESELSDLDRKLGKR